MHVLIDCGVLVCQIVGNNGAGAQLHTDQTESNTGWRNEEEAAEEQEEVRPFT